MIIEYKGTTLDIPFDLSERTVNHHANFKAHEQVYLKACIEGNEKPDDIEVTDQINAAFIDTVGQVVFGDLSKVPHVHIEDDIQAMFEHGYTLTPLDEPSIMRLYTHYVTLCNRYEPGRVELTYSIDWWTDEKQTEKTTYWIENNEAARLHDQKAYTSGEVILVQEWRRRIKNAIQQKGDPEGNLALTMDQTDLALLLRKNGEAIPANQGKRRLWLNKRKRVFNDFPLDELFRIRFFLIAIGIQQAKTRIIDSSLRSRTNQTSLATQKSSKPKGPLTIAAKQSPKKDSTS